MTRPSPPTDLDLETIALFLDLDGTLIEFAPRPGDVIVPPDLPPLLERLHGALGGALAIVSGRPIAAIDQLLAPLHLPAAGTHGAELRRTPTDPVHEAGEPLSGHLRDQINDIGKELQSQWHGLFVEDKGSAMAIHYRLAPDAKPALRKALGMLDLGDRWQILSGHSVYEIRAAAQNKGRAVTALCAAPPFAGRAPVFVGDDKTDLDGISAAMSLGGHAVAVGHLDAPNAQWGLPDVAAVLTWLRALVG